MGSFTPDPRRHSGIAALTRTSIVPNGYDLVAVSLLAGLAVLAIHGAGAMRAPLEALTVAPVVLDPTRLPEYALRTTLRMLAAIIASLVFTFLIATLAAKSRRAEMVIVPALDILQSVPVLGFLTFTVAFFMGLFPDSQLGRNALPSSQSSPVRPGTWPFRSINPCAACRVISTRLAAASACRPGSASGVLRLRSPRRA